MAMKISKSSKSSKTTHTATAALPLFTALYIRVSTERQKEEGYSLDAQQSRLQSYCDAQGWTVSPAHIYIDAGISGKSTARPAFQAMLKAAQAGQIARIVVTKMDRLARNTQDLLETVNRLQSFGCALVLLDLNIDTGTPTGMLVATVLGGIAQWEREQIAERVKSGKVQKAAQGGDNGRYCPLGYSFTDGRYSVEESAAAVVRSIFAEFTTGQTQTLTAIASRLNAQGAPTARGGKWYPATIRYILTNGFYAGLTQYDGQTTPASHPAIIPADTYSAAITRLEK